MSAGIQFPLTEKGDRSTTPFAKAVLVEAAKALGDDALCQAIQSEKDWRNKYNVHYLRLFEAQVRADSTKALDSLKAALSKAQAMDFEAENGAVPLSQAMQNAPAAFDIATITGTATMPEFEVPDEYHGCTLKGADIEAQVQKWANYGCMEPDCAQAINAGIKDIGSLKGRTFVVIGAGSELGPLKHLLRAGATVAALATRKPQRWEKLIDFAKSTPGTLLLPVTKGSNTSDEKQVAQACGVDLMKEAPAVAEWVQRVVKEAPGLVTIGTYLYIDGGANVCVTVASDYIIEAATAVGKSKVSFAWLGSPATAHVVPNELMAIQDKAHGEASWWQKMTLQTKRPIVQTAADGREVHIVDGYAVMQGPNYALAQHLRQWRAMVLYSQGFVVSTPMAPICRTESVCHNGTMKAALDGMAYLPPLEAFHPETASALLFAILVSDLSEPMPQLKSPLDLFTRKSFHSGTWRCPFSFESAGMMMFVMGKVAGKNTPN